MRKKTSIFYKKYIAAVMAFVLATSTVTIYALDEQATQDEYVEEDNPEEENPGEENLENENSKNENFEDAKEQNDEESSVSNEAAYLKEELSMMEQQRLIEQELLQWYEESDAKTLATAVVHQDIYDMAPLTAIVLFDTPDAEKVKVTVHGKTEDCDISYETTSNIHHEVQIFGLYPDYQNTVTIETESGESRDFQIETEPVPEAMTNITKTLFNGEQGSERLFYICDKWRTVFDKNGDIRWYMDGIAAAFSGIDEVDTENHCFWFSTEGSSASMASVYCVSFTGRLLGKYFSLGKSAHHDATLLPDGKLMYLSKWRVTSSEISILDPETGSLELYMDPQELFDDSLGSLEYQTRDDTWDYGHINAVQYIPEDDSLLLSFRNQHMIMCMDYETKEVKWALTPAYEINNGTVEALQKRFSNILILPVEGDTAFEWFYSQHSPNLISYDPETDMYDITLFDNGTDRFLASESGNAGLNQEKYSRLVRYQIDAKNRTVKQVYEFGRENPSHYSDQCGSAQYLVDEDRYIANYPGMETPDDKRISTVSESDGEGNEIAEYILENIPDGSYRTIAYDLDTYVTTENVITDPKDHVETYFHDGKHWEVADNNESEQDEIYNVSEIKLTEKGLLIRGNMKGLEKKEKAKFRLLAIDSQGRQYSMPLICYRHNRFYMPGVDMKALPEDTYQLAIYLEINGEPVGYKTIPYLYSEMMATAAGPMPDQNQENYQNAESGNAVLNAGDNADSSVLDSNLGSEKWKLLENTTKWNVEIIDVRKESEFKTIVPVIQYDMSIDNVEYINRPSEGMCYLLLNLQVKKGGTGAGAFSWKNVTLNDENGNAYARMDDIFLEDHAIDRMAGTDIKLGTKQGWICFEIPEEVADQTLTFVYQGKDEGCLSYQIEY